MSIVTLYAHEESEEAARDLVKEYGVNYDDAFKLLNGKPLYEVEFDFDVDTGKCVEARVDGEVLRA